MKNGLNPGLLFFNETLAMLKQEMLVMITMIRGGYTSKVSHFSSNSFVMVKYKTFHLKHYIVFVKICPPTGQITFWDVTSKMTKIKMLLA